MLYIEANEKDGDFYEELQDTYPDLVTIITSNDLDARETKIQVFIRTSRNVWNKVAEILEKIFFKCVVTIEYEDKDKKIKMSIPINSSISEEEAISQIRELVFHKTL